MTKTKMVVLINREGGAAKAAGEKLEEQVRTAFEKAGGTADVRMLAAEEMDQAIERAAKKETRFVIAGGDGTVAAAAQVLTGSKTELAILPLGTLNHFAKDLGIPLKLEKAAELALHGNAEAIDVGEVNGRRFINNASVGLYPFMVRDRDDIRERRGWPKWLATVPASWDAFSRLRHHRLKIDLGDGKLPVVTPLLFVGNNRYSLDAGTVGARESLTEGKLAVYAIARSSRTALLWFGIRALVGLADRARDFATIGDSAAFTVESSDGEIEIALDGEVQRIKLPAKFKVRPGGLQIVAP
ncbi:MAG: diacylglycerol kinase family protein [Sphingomonas sp.]